MTETTNRKESAVTKVVNQEEIAVPEVFMSYSWSSEEHKLWVEKLADSLSKQRINVVLDKWGLNAGKSTRKFMQKIRTCEKILVICDQDYCDKLHDPSSSVAKEYELIADKKFNEFDLDKVLVATVQTDRNNELCTPQDCSEDLPLDMTNAATYDENIKSIARWAYGIEKSRDSEQDLPDWLNEELTRRGNTSLIFEDSATESTSPEAGGKADRYMEERISKVPGMKPLIMQYFTRLLENIRVRSEVEDTKVKLRNERLPSLFWLGDEFLEGLIRSAENQLVDKEETSLPLLVATMQSLACDAIALVNDSQLKAYCSRDEAAIDAATLEEWLAQDMPDKVLYDKSPREFSATTPLTGKMSQCIYIPLQMDLRKRKQPKYKLILIGLRRDERHTELLSDIMDTIFESSNHFEDFKGKSTHLCLAYDSLKEKYGHVSHDAYQYRFEEFKNKLQDIEVYFEPVVKFSRHAHKFNVWGVEALARIGDRAPVHFFEVAELWGVEFQTELDIYILDKALEKFRACATKQKIGSDTELIPISINVYPNTITRNNYRKVLFRNLKKYRLDGENLILEISEKDIFRVSNNNQNALDEFLKAKKELKKANVRLAIDDFGVGHSSLTRMLQLNPDFVKIDREVLLDGSEVAMTLIKTLVDIKNRVGQPLFRVIVEGLDEITSKIVSLDSLVNEIGVEFIQGYLFEKAQPTIVKRLPKEKYQQIEALLNWKTDEG